MFKRAPVSTTKVIDVLMNPNPLFVSFVDHGANQTPLAVLKSDGDNPHDTMSKRAAATTTSKPSTTKDDTDNTALVALADSGTVTVTKGADIHRIEFSKTVFKADADVSAFLTANGYKDFEIVENGDAGFAIEGIGAESFEAVQKIELPNGVTFHVGKLKAGIADSTTRSEDPPAEPPAGTTTEPDAAAAGDGADAGGAGDGAGDGTAGDTETKGDNRVHLIVAPNGHSLSRKFDTWNMGTGLTLSSVLSQASSDGIPAGYYGVMECFQAAYANVVRTSNHSLIPSLTAELGDVLTKMANLFATVAKSDAVGAETLLSFTPPTPSTVAKSDSPASAGLTQADVDAAVKVATDALIAKLDAMDAKLREDLATKSEVATAVTTVNSVSESVAKHDTRIARVERVRQVKQSDAAPAAGGSQGGQSNGGGQPTTQTPISKSDANLYGIQTHARRV